VQRADLDVVNDGPDQGGQGGNYLLLPPVVKGKCPRAILSSDRALIATGMVQVVSSRIPVEAILHWLILRSTSRLTR
jgi:hypothetical protein